MLQLSIASAALAVVCALVALYELTNGWWALLACAVALGFVSWVTGHLADAVPQAQRQHESHE